MLNEDNKFLIHSALNMWANYIETGDVIMSSTDAQNCCQEFNALSSDQMKMIIRLRDLATEELKK